MGFNSGFKGLNQMLLRSKARKGVRGDHCAVLEHDIQSIAWTLRRMPHRSAFWMERYFNLLPICYKPVLTLHQTAWSVITAVKCEYCSAPN